MSSLARGTWIEIRKNLEVNGDLESRPSQEGRGLKYERRVRGEFDALSSLARGTWIEICDF